jgi:hypothetical protein
VAASAAAVILAVSLVPWRSNERSTPPATPPALTLEPIPAQGLLHTATRGGGGEIAVIATGDSARSVALMVGPLDVPDGQIIDAEVFAAGEMILRQALGARMASGVRVILRSSGKSLATGNYQLRLIGTGVSTRPDTTQFTFRLVR